MVMISYSCWHLYKPADLGYETSKRERKKEDRQIDKKRQQTKKRRQTHKMKKKADRQIKERQLRETIER